MSMGEMDRISYFEIENKNIVKYKYINYLEFSGYVCNV